MHPIAGRCKHCKADLNEARGARPQAKAALPALAGGGNPPVRADATPIPAPSPLKALAKAAAEPQPILPPRESARMPVMKPSGSLLKNWPVIVIILAALAIAAAVVIMVWPASKDAKADTRLPPPPAPERMSTDPLAPQGSLTPPQAPKAPGAPTAPDPWSNKSGQADPNDPIDPTDPSKDPMNPRNGLGGVLGGATGNVGMMFNVFQHACSRMTACGNSQLSSVCSTITQAFGAMPVPSCAAAQRCLEKIDQLDCNATLSNQADVLAAVTTFQDCSDAMSPSC